MWWIVLADQEYSILVMYLDGGGGGGVDKLGYD